MKRKLWGIAALGMLAALLVTGCASGGTGAAQKPTALVLREAAALSAPGASSDDMRKAARLYKTLARGNDGYTLIYVPAISESVPAQVQRLQTGGATPGNAEAQFRLGLMYRDGRGVGRSLQKARRWLTEAAAQGYPGADAALSGLVDR